MSKKLNAFGNAPQEPSFLTSKFTWKRGRFVSRWPVNHTRGLTSAVTVLVSLMPRIVVTRFRLTWRWRCSSVNTVWESVTSTSLWLCITVNGSAKAAVTHNVISCTSKTMVEIREGVCICVCDWQCAMCLTEREVLSPNLLTAYLCNMRNMLPSEADWLWDKYHPVFSFFFTDTCFYLSQHSLGRRLGAGIESGLKHQVYKRFNFSKGSMDSSSP